ncbi:UDP-glucose 4-epimerase GalE [Rhizobium helianthi]|uniref:UDP-glucose 4-epimerase n=1 Tax=Rhizobium helianthi TaxID=1132695 RepID=A0ABW4M4J9_9HYPH
MRRYVLVTGGAGFIGSHICKALHLSGFTPVALDNLSTGHADAVRWGLLVETNVGDLEKVARALETYRPVAVVHCAASAYVGESVSNPQQYYENNVLQGLALLSACLQTRTLNVVFSSSCATYGACEQPLIDETTPQTPINPYGRTKLILELALEDYAMAYGLRYVALRYFNAAGADPDSELFERHDPETHLIPRALMAASGQIDALDIFGTDYATPDGTCVRDYVHVSDLADAHVAAVRHLEGGGGALRLNLGTGMGHSVFDVLRTIETLTGRSVPFSVGPQRAGDPAALVADPRQAQRMLRFSPERSDLRTIVSTAAPGFGLRMRP